MLFFLILSLQFHPSNFSLLLNQVISEASDFVPILVTLTFSILAKEPLITTVAIIGLFSSDIIWLAVWQF